MINIINKIKSKIPPGLFLLFIAPFLGELLSGHQTPLEFFNPISFLLTALPYGFGAIICRELTLKWKKGWISFFLLALAFGIYEEGIVVRSFFNPNWSELGSSAIYNFAGINWTFSFILIYFHILISIWASVKLSEIIYSNKKNKRWVTGKKFTLCIIGLLLWLPAGWFMTSYVPPIINYILCFILLISLILFAKYLPKIKIKRNKFKTPKPITFFLIGIINISLNFYLILIMPEQGIFLSLWTIIFIFISFNTATFLLLKYLTGNFVLWKDTHRLALLSGFLSFFIFMSFLKELEGFTGSSIVALISIWFLFKLYKSIKKKNTCNNF